MTYNQKQQKRYLIRLMRRRAEAFLGGCELDLIDTTDYRDLFGAIKPDSVDDVPSIYFSQRLR